MNIVITQGENEKRPSEFKFGKISLKRSGYSCGIPIYKAGVHMRHKKVLYIMFACAIFGITKTEFYIKFKDDDNSRIGIRKNDWRYCIKFL